MDRCGPTTASACNMTDISVRDPPVPTSLPRRRPGQRALIKPAARPSPKRAGGNSDWRPCVEFVAEADLHLVFSQLMTRSGLERRRRNGQSWRYGGILG